MIVKFSITENPELAEIIQGAMVKGAIDGTVISNDNGVVSVEVRPATMETENRADKELRKLTGENEKPVSRLTEAQRDL